MSIVNNSLQVQEQRLTKVYGEHDKDWRVSDVHRKVLASYKLMQELVQSKDTRIQELELMANQWQSAALASQLQGTVPNLQPSLSLAYKTPQCMEDSNAYERLCHP